MSLKKKFAFVFVLMLFRISGEAQPVQLWLDTVAGCNGDTLEIRLHTSDFYQVGSLTLYIQFSDQALQYDTTVQIHPALAGLLVNPINTGQSAVALAWFTGNLNPVNLGQGVLARLRFIKLADSANLSFGSLCEITNAVGQPLQAQYSDGKVVMRHINIQQQPNNVMVLAGNPAYFSLSVSDQGVSYRWQSSQDGFSWLDLNDDATYGGTSSDLLTLFQPDISFHNQLFRCKVSKENCTDISDAAILQIDTSQSILKSSRPQNGLLPYPNPFYQQITIPWIGLPVKTCTFVLRDMQGSMVEIPVGSHIRPTDGGLEITGLNLASGSYLIQLYIKDISNNTHQPAFLILSK